MTTVIKISEDCIRFINNEGPRTLQNLCVFVCLGYVSCPTCKFFTHENFSTYCDTGHLCIWSYPMSRYTYKCFWAFGSWIVNTCFNDLGMSQTRFEHPKFHMWGKHLTDCTTAAARIFVRDALFQKCHSMTEY